MKLHNPTMQQRKWTKLSIERFWSIFGPQPHLSVQQCLCFSKNHPLNYLSLNFILQRNLTNPECYDEDLKQRVRLLHFHPINEFKVYPFIKCIFPYLYWDPTSHIFIYKGKQAILEQTRSNCDKFYAILEARG